MTPKRADATCLIRASVGCPSGPGAYQAGSSPPSPVLAAPPSAWIPSVSARWASGDSAPDAHRRDDEPPGDRTGVLDLVERHRRGASRRADAEPVADERRLAAEGVAIRGQRGVDAGRRVVGRGERGERGRVGGAVQVELAVAAEAREAGVGEPVRPCGRRDGLRLREAGQLDSSEVRRLEPAGPRRGGREAARDERRRELQGLEQLAADVAGDGRDAHPGQDLAQAGVERQQQVGDGVGGREGLCAARPRLLPGERDQQPRVDHPGAGGDDHRQAVHVEHVAGVEHEVGATAQAGLGERGVDGARGEDRRDGQSGRFVEARRGVGQHDDLGARPGRVEGGRREPVQRSLEPGLARGGGPGGVEPADRAVRGAGPRADRVEEPVEVDDDRAADPDRRGAGRHAAQEGRPPTELHLEVHDRALALGIDRRVGDLGERLPEVVGDGSRDPAASGQRRVVAHAPQRLVAVDGHRPHVEAQLLGIQPVEIAQGGGGSIGVGRCGVGGCRRLAVGGHGRGGRDDRDPDLLVGEHVARRVVQRQPAEHPRLGVGVREHAPGRRVHEQQLAGRETAGADDLARCQRDGAGLGRDGDHAVDGHGPGRRPEPVAIEQRADPAAVAEHEGAGSVPRRDEAGDPAPERGDGRMRRAAEAGRLGHEGEQRGLERPPGRDQQLEGLVERARVRDARGEQGPGGAEPVGGLPAAGGDARVVAPAADGLAVAADGVDLAVVGDEPERLGERPHRLGVGRIALVEHRERNVDRLGQVGEQLGEAGAGHQALVDGRARRRRDDREGVESGGPSGRVRATARARQGELELGLGRLVGPGHQRLEDVREGGAGLAAEGGGVDRDPAPHGCRETLGGQRGGDDRSGVGRAGRATPRPRGEHREDARPLAGFAIGIEEAQERRRQGEEDPRAIARGAVRGEGPAMTEGAEAPEREREDATAGRATGVRDEPDAARVVLVARVVQPRLSSSAVRGLSLWGAVVGHRRLQSAAGRTGGRSAGTARRAHRAVGVIRPGRPPRRGRRCRGRPPRPSRPRGARGRGRRP